MTEHRSRLVTMTGSHPAALTFQQRSYVDGHHGTAALNCIDGCVGLLLEGDLDIHALARSVTELVCRHDALRTRFTVANGPLMQYVEPPPGETLTVVSSPDPAESGLPFAERAPEAFYSIAHLSTGWTEEPLLVAKLVTLATRETVFFFGAHHLISDYATRTLLMRELWAIYAALIRREAICLPLPKMQFSDYRAWQHHTYATWPEKHQRYWDDHLSGGAGIQWPAGMCSESQSTEDTRCYSSLVAPSTVSSALKETARHARMPLSFIILSIYVSVVARYCDQNDLVIATTFSGRDRAAHRQVAGYLAHPLYLRIQLRGLNRFVDLFRAVSEEYQRSILHRDFGELLSSASDLASATIFQWFPSDLGSGMPETTGLAIKQAAPVFDAARFLIRPFNLMFILYETPEGISAFVLYRGQASSQRLVEQIVSCLRETALSIINSPNAHPIRSPA